MFIPEGNQIAYSPRAMLGEILTTSSNWLGWELIQPGGVVRSFSFICGDARCRVWSYSETTQMASNLHEGGIPLQRPRAPFALLLPLSCKF